MKLTINASKVSVSRCGHNSAVITVEVDTVDATGKEHSNGNLREEVVKSVGCYTVTQILGTDAILDSIGFEKCAAHWRARMGEQPAQARKR